MSELYGLMVIRNEADRYLAASCAHLRAVADRVFVFDDQSSDDSRDVAIDAGAVVHIRPSSVPSFAESERACRQAAWRAIEHLVEPGDWVVSIDADEFVVSRNGASPRDVILAAIGQADDESCDTVEFPVAEVFGMLGNRPLVRTDGEWGRIRARRLMRWKPGLSFPEGRVTPSIPTSHGATLRVGEPSILHAGYLRVGDRFEKHARYSTPADHHSRAHINSILTESILEPLSHPIPAAIADALEAALQPEGTSR